MTKQEMEDYKDYILNAVVCEVCNEGFQRVEDAIDAGTDLYVHRECSGQWHGVWLGAAINPNCR